VSFAAITLCISSQPVFIVVSVSFVIGSVRKLLDTSSCVLPLRERGALLERGFCRPGIGKRRNLQSS
jgi:hypothetical protein